MLRTANHPNHLVIRGRVLEPSLLLKLVDVCGLAFGSLFITGRQPAEHEGFACAWATCRIGGMMASTAGRSRLIGVVSARVRLRADGLISYDDAAVLGSCRDVPR